MLSPCLIQIFINSLRLPETDARKMIMFPEVANFWYFTDTSGTVHPLHIHVLSVRLSLPLSTVIHTLMALRDPSQMSVHMG